MKQDKERSQIQMRVLHNLVMLVEEFPQYTLSQHITHFMRSMGDTKDKYFWTDLELLKKIEFYYDELCTELKEINIED